MSKTINIESEPLITSTLSQKGPRPSEAWRDHFNFDVPEVEAKVLQAYSEVQCDLDHKCNKSGKSRYTLKGDRDNAWKTFLSELVEKNYVAERMTKEAFKKWVVCKRAQYYRWCKPASGAAALNENEKKLKEVKIVKQNSSMLSEMLLNQC
jgi:hypothetical protein